MEKLGLIYCFDNLNQIDKFKKSISSIQHEENVDLIIMLKSEILNNEIYKDAISATKLNITEIQMDEFKIPGMFYWILAPFLSNYKKYVQLDNDVILNKISINDFLSKYKRKLKNKSLLGMKSQGWRNNDSRRTIIHFRKNYLMYLLKINKYINTGVVLINGEKIREEVSKDLILNELENYIDICKNNKLRITDQEFLHIYHSGWFGYIEKKYNVRIFSLYDLKMSARKSEFILHYNLHSKIDGKWMKFDFLNQYEKFDSNTIAENATEFWSSSSRRKGFGKKAYKRNLKKLIEKTKENENSNF